MRERRLKTKASLNKSCTRGTTNHEWSRIEDELFLAANRFPRHVDSLPRHSGRDVYYPPAPLRSDAITESVRPVLTFAGEAIATAAVVTSDAVTKAAKATKKKVTRGCSRVCAPMTQITKEIKMGLWSLSGQEFRLL